MGTVIYRKWYTTLKNTEKFKKWKKNSWNYELREWVQVNRGLRNRPQNTPQKEYKEKKDWNANERVTAVQNRMKRSNIFTVGVSGEGKEYLKRF